MARRRDPGTKAETRLARARMARGVTQEELAEAIGISLPTYRRVERGETDNPPLRYLVNAALGAGRGARRRHRRRRRDWKAFVETRPEPPNPDEFWRAPTGPTRRSRTS